jgi:hypothetical protein
MTTTIASVVIEKYWWMVQNMRIVDVDHVDPQSILITEVVEGIHMITITVKVLMISVFCQVHIMKIAPVY